MAPSSRTVGTSRTSRSPGAAAVTGSSAGRASGSAYSLVIADGSTGYVAPHAPGCAEEQRYLAVRRTLGSGWGIVDRRTGRLLLETHPDQHRYPDWEAALQVIRSLNAGRAQGVSALQRNVP